jgi:hypothetical protein
MTGNRSGAVLSKVSLIQGLYYVVTGIWPVASAGTFQLITGPKRDVWLVKTVGALLGGVGAVLALAGWRDTVQAEIPLLGMASAATLATVDIVYYRKGILRWVYLVDALLEAGLIAGWIAGWRSSRSR